MKVETTDLLMDSMWSVREKEEPKVTPRSAFAYCCISSVACLLRVKMARLSDMSLCFQKKRQGINIRKVQVHFGFVSYLPGHKLQRQRQERQN